MPSMPVKLPRRLLSGLDRPRSARMKQTPAIRYASRTQAGWACAASAMSSSIRLAFPLLVHREHALGDREPPEDVHACERDSDQAEPFRTRTSGRGGCDKGADDNDRGNGVGDAHQRRVECRGDRPDHEIANETGEHENRQDRDEVHDPSGWMSVAVVAGRSESVESRRTPSVNYDAVSDFLTFARAHVGVL